MNFSSINYVDYLKSLFVRSKFHFYFNESIAEYALKLAYLSKFSKWLNQHPCRQFNRKDDKGRYDLYQFLLETEKLNGAIDYLEFGVSTGESLKWWIKNNTDSDSRFFGFDTFTGLPENWDHVPKCKFSTNGKPPSIPDKRCHYEIGLFQDTLFDFLRRHELDRRTVVHLDADLYSSTLFVLTALMPKLKAGDILIFDEIGSLQHPTHEFRAFQDFLSAYQPHYEVLAASNYYLQVAMKLI